MSKHWSEQLDPSKHRDFMTGAQDTGGLPRAKVGDSVIGRWTYFVRVNSFTFQFALENALTDFEKAKR